jgi:hypothetical protein
MVTSAVLSQNVWTVIVQHALTVKTEAAYCSEVIVPTHNIAWCHNPEGHSYDTLVFLTV